MRNSPPDDPGEPGDPLARAIHDWLDPDRFGAAPPRPDDARPDLDRDDERRMHSLLHESRSGASPSRPRTPTPAIERVGPYRILGPLGAGGVGHVHRAEDERDGRIVALKLLREEWLSSERERERFRREAEAAAKVAHRNCARLEDAGEDRGRPHLVYEFVDGESLDRRLRVERGAGRVLPLPAVLELGVQLASGLEALHAAGIVHRDVKPSNVVLARDGRAVLVDFGLATGAGLDTLTRTGEFAGSLPYAAPEQVQRGARDVDARADLYSLAATLYECATGLPIFRAASVEPLILAIVNSEPPPPSRLAPGLPEAFDRVVSKALEKDPAHRYRSATELGLDLEALARGAPVAARAPSPWRRARKLIRARPLAASALGAIVVVAAVVPSALYVQEIAANRRLLAEQQRTREQRARAEENLARSIEALNDIVKRAADPSLRTKTGTESVRRGMLEDARRCFEALMATNVESAMMAIESARALRQLGALCSELGDLDAAETAYRTAIERLRRWVAQIPGNADLHHDLADGLNGLTTALQLRGDLAGAEAASEESLAAYRRAHEIAPDSIWPRRGIASILDRKAASQESRGDYEAAEATWREALTHQSSVTAADGSSLQRRGLAHVCNNLASFLQRRGRVEEAITFFRQALDEHRTILAAGPDPEVARERLGASSNLAYGYTRLGRRDESVPIYREVIALAEEEHEAAPDDDITTRLLGIAHFRLAADLGRDGDDTGCETHYARAIELQEALANRSRQIVRHAVDAAITLASRGLRRKKQARPEEARADFLRAKEWIDGAVAASPENVEWKNVQRQIDEGLRQVDSERAGN